MKKKLENFIFYYKYHIIALIFVIIVIVVLTRDKSGNVLEFVIVDDTSKMDMTAAQNMMHDFEKQKGLKDNTTSFRYKTMYPNQEQYNDVAFEVAGIDDYEKCFTNGAIDMVITSANTLEEELEETQYSEEEASEESIEKKKSYEVVPLEQIFSEEEMSKYEKYIYFVNGEATGIIFDKCKKAEEYFGDNYPTPYHYILQVAVGSADDKYVKMFLQYLMNE